MLIVLRDLHARKIMCVLLCPSLPSSHSLSHLHVHTQSSHPFPPPFPLSRAAAASSGRTSALPPTSAPHARLRSDSWQRKLQFKGWEVKRCLKKISGKVMGLTGAILCKSQYCRHLFCYSHQLKAINHSINKTPPPAQVTLRQELTDALGITLL